MIGPLEHAPKPKIGDILTVIDIFAEDPAPSESPITTQVEVIEVFDNIAELDDDWDLYPGQVDVDNYAGIEGTWYAVVRFPDKPEEGTWSCASYEVISE